MPFTAVVSETEVRDVLDTANEARNSGISIYAGMSYEDGVAAVIEWLTIEGTAPQFEDGDVEAAYDAESDSDEDDEG